MDLTDAIKEAYEYAPQDVIYYDTLEINHDDLEVPILIVNSHVPFTATLGTFLPVSFGFTLPETIGGSVGNLNISIDGIPGQVRSILRAISQTRTPITATYRQYLEGSAEPDAELLPLQIISVKETYTGVVAVATMPDLAGAFFPRKLMTSELLPGLVGV